MRPEQRLSTFIRPLRRVLRAAFGPAFEALQVRQRCVEVGAFVVGHRMGAAEEVAAGLEVAVAASVYLLQVEDFV